MSERSKLPSYRASIERKTEGVERPRVYRKDGTLPGLLHKVACRVQGHLESGGVVQIIWAQALTADCRIIAGKICADRSPDMFLCRRIGPIHLVVRCKFFFRQSFTIFVILLEGLFLHFPDKFQSTDLSAGVEEIVLHKLVGLVIVLRASALVIKS